MPESASGLITLTRRSVTSPPGVPDPPLRLELSADERTRLRGHRRSVCGRDLLLQLDRGQPLQPGEWLRGVEGAPPVRVEAAAEPLLLVRSEDPLDLLRAAYHLGNRHVALELRSGELRLLEDPVLADLLVQRGLELERCRAPFLPEAGAYAAGVGHRHGHDRGHNHVHNHGHGQEDGHQHGHDHGVSPGHHHRHDRGPDQDHDAGHPNNHG